MRGFEEEINRALVMFRVILSEDKFAFDPEYLKLGRYVRLKLTDLNVSIRDKELGYLNELKYASCTSFYTVPGSVF